MNSTQINISEILNDLGCKVSIGEIESSISTISDIINLFEIEHGSNNEQTIEKAKKAFDIVRIAARQHEQAIRTKIIEQQKQKSRQDIIIIDDVDASCNSFRDWFFKSQLGKYPPLTLKNISPYPPAISIKSTENSDLKKSLDLATKALDDFKVSTDAFSMGFDVNSSNIESPHPKKKHFEFTKNIQLGKCLEISTIHKNEKIRNYRPNGRIRDQSPTIKRRGR